MFRRRGRNALLAPPLHTGLSLRGAIAGDTLSAREPGAAHPLVPGALHVDVQGLSRVYGVGKGLQPTTFQVLCGESIAVVGHNGAGKSTLLKMLAGWILPESGSASVRGITLGDRPGLACETGFVPEKTNLFEFFSVEYNLLLFARLFRLPRTRVEETLGQFELLLHRRNRIEQLSKGLRQRVSIGRALLADPPLLILDEPTSGLDFDMTRYVHALLGGMHAAGKTILFTSHRPEEIRTLATRIIALHQGCIVFDGTPDAYFRSSTHAQLYA
jgi:ABC-2 type transport system ATP-binding protein